MKHSSIKAILKGLVLPGLLTLSAAQMSGEPLGTAFNYQGRLQDNGQPAEGAYDFVFTLYDSPTNQVPIYSGILNEDVAVVGGVFSTEIDYSAELFAGQELWLEVAVRPGQETGNFALLAPRQHLTATPYAHYARRAAVAESAETVAHVPWSSVEGLPASLADGEDNDTTYSAGEGMVLGAGNTLQVAFGDNGNAVTAARADHDHFQQKWVGATNNTAGLEVQNKSPWGVGIIGKNDEWGSGITAWQGAGVVGDSSTDPGVAGFSNTGPGVYGTITALNGVFDAIKGENPSGSGRAVAGYATSTNGANIGTLGQTASSGGGVGIRGYASATTGTSYGGRFSNKSPDGAAIQAYSDLSTVADLDITSTANNSTVLEVTTRGAGHVGKFVADNLSSTKDALVAEHHGKGDAIYATTIGSGNAGHFNLLINHTNNSALLATGLGSARALKATSPYGEAVRAETESGVALVVSSGDVDGTALSVDGGEIQVKGAGINTPTAVFIHRCTDANTPATPGGNFVTVIDHPMCNNNPNAILFVTPRISWDNTSGFSTYEDLAVAYSAPRGKWCLLNTSIVDEFGDFDVGDSFNIMVIQP